jgi:hypothetical protein
MSFDPVPSDVQAVKDMLNPYNFVPNLSFHSPLVLTSSIVLLTLMFQNKKGYIYLLCLFISCCLRHVAYATAYSGGKKTPSPDPKCPTILFGGKYADAHISTFIFLFTFVYFFAPMMMFSSYNIPLLIGLLVYWVIDTGVKCTYKCFSVGEFFGNVVFGAIFAISSVMSIQALGGRKYLYFNEVSSDKEVCSVAKNQTFKCAVYKNGELIGNM